MSITTTEHPAPIKHHWIMTVQMADGRQGTTDGVIDVVPGIHTHESTYTEVLRTVRQWIGSDSVTVTVLFFTVVPDQL